MLSFYPFESDNLTKKHFIHVRNLSILFINRHAVQYLEKLTVRCWLVLWNDTSDMNWYWMRIIR